MFAFLPRLLYKFIPLLAKLEANRRQRLYAAREARRRQALSARPRLEALEDRVAPAVDTFTAAVDTSYANAGNWDLGSVPGAMDSAVIPSGKICTLSATTDQTVAGLTVQGELDVSSKLSVTTANMMPGSTFKLLTGGEVDVLGSADLGGTGTINGHIDAQGASVTFDPSSSMVLASGVQLTGSGVYNLFGPVTLATALSQSSTMVLSSNGSTALGSLTGPGSLSDGGEFDWNGGSIGLTGSDGATFLANADLKLQGSDNKTVSVGTLTNECNGSEIGGTGRLVINGNAAWDNLGNPNCDVTIPFILAQGSFTNEANGLFDAKGDTTVSGNFTNLGRLQVASASTLTLDSGGTPSATLDGTLQLDGDLTLLGTILSPSGFDQLAGGGTLKVGNGSSAGGLSIGSGYEALLSGNVEVTGTGTLGGSGEVNNNGLLKLDIGSTTGLGSYVQSSIGTLELQAAGLGVWSSLTDNGAAQLSGTLQIDFLNGYTPSSGTTLPVLSAASVGAHFDTTPDKMTINYGSTGVSATEK